MKPPKKITLKAVYDKVDGPVYFAKGGKVYKYANGGTVDGLSPQDQATYDSLPDAAAKAGFLKTLGISLPATSTATGLTPTTAAGIGAAGNAVADIVDANTDNSNPLLKQAGLGAAKGAAAGLAFGPWGAAIGGGIGLVGGALKGKAQREQQDADALAKKNADALAEKQRRDAAAKANMNPWEIGYGMADGGKIERNKQETADLLKHSQIVDSLRKNVLDPYMIQNKLKEIPYEKVNELAPEFYNSFGKVAGNYANKGVDAKRINTLQNPQGTNEFGTQGNVPLNQSAYGTLMQNAILPHMATSKATIANEFDKSFNNLPYKKGGKVKSEPSAAKAAEMLHDGTVHGKPITDKQRKYFGYLSNKLAKGGTVNFANEEGYKKWLAYGHIHHKFHGKEKISIAGKPHKVDHKAEGGKIHGAGTAKSDSIKAKVEAGSFIVPAENASKAAVIRKKFFGDVERAELQQKDGEHVKLSNGEHMFTPQEVEHLEANGVDLNELAPNQENGKYGKQNGGEVEQMAEGGKVSKKDIEQGVAMKQSELDSIDEEINKIEKGTKQLDKQIKLPQLQLKRVQAAQQIELAKDPNNYTDLGKGLGYSFTPKTQTPAAVADTTTATTPESKKAAVNKGGVANVGRANLLKALAPNAAAVVDDGNGIIPETNPTKSNVDIFAKKEPAITPPTTTPEIEAAKAKLADPNTSADEKSKIGEFLKSNANLLPGIAGLGVAGFQIGKGIKQLNSLGARPVDTIDADFAASVDQAKNDAKYGISPEERNIAERGIESTRQADVANIVNAAGGSGGTALANIRGASNQAQENLGKLSAESERLRLEKQRYANNLVGQKAAMKRQLFGDKMNAFDTNQQAGSQLLGAGIQNAFGALRYTGELANQNKLAKTGQGGAYTGATKSSKRDYMSAAGGDETKARALANQYGENYDSLNNF